MPDPNSSPSLGTRIRRARPEDAEAIAGLLGQAFAAYRPGYTPEAFAATVLSSADVLSRIEEGPVWVTLPPSGQPLLATVSAVATAQGCYIRSMAVLPSARGQGLGWQLLECAEHFALEASSLAALSEHDAISRPGDRTLRAVRVSP